MGRFRNVCISKWSFSCFWRFDILACSTHRCRWLGICQGDTCILGEERWLPRFPTHRRRWLGEKRRDVRVIFNDKFSWWINSTHRRRWLWGDSECWRCCYTCNSPAPVTLGGSEGIQPCKKQLDINPTNTFFFLPLPRNIFTNIFFLAFRWKKNIGL